MQRSNGFLPFSKSSGTSQANVLVRKGLPLFFASVKLNYSLDFKPVNRFTSVCRGNFKISLRTDQPQIQKLSLFCLEISKSVLCR